MASKKKVSLHDYDLSTTLGTGIFHDINISRFFRTCATRQE